MTFQALLVQDTNLPARPSALNMPYLCLAGTGINMARLTMFVAAAALVLGAVVCLPAAHAVRSLRQVPTITCPSDITLEATNSTFLGTVVSWEVMASDDIAPVCDWVSDAL